ncbi:DinB family protein [Thermodesulfobacteriota bacterium]
MKIIADKIRELIEGAKPDLLKISPEIAGKKADPDIWSKKEILGHLIDSASNNHQRLVRGAQNAARDFPTYNQDRWVKVQCYNEMDWLDLVDLFVEYNFHLCRVIAFLPREVLGNLCNVGKKNPVTLKFVIEDYLRHLRHHIEDILGSAP